VNAGIGFGSAIPGFILSATGFAANAQQSETALLGIQLSFAIIPAAVMIPAAAAMLFYRLDHKTVAQVEGDLATRRASSE
jgi:GPH family glycoside/pentoside/hexuronide:cation symporter